MTRWLPGRDLSLDCLRGIDVLLMVLVNLQGPAGPTILRHAEWNGLTLADAVFPIFLLIVGISVSLAFDGGGGRFDRGAVLRRAILLFAIGVGLNWLLRPGFDPDLLRWTGVLQRIAIVYLVCAAVVAASRSAAAPLALALGAMLLHTILLLAVPAPGAPIADLSPGGGWSGWLDRQLLPGLILRGSWDPEGVLSTLPSLASGLFGVVMARLAGAGGRTVRLAGGGALLVLAGSAAAPFLPINKNLWTASFVLVTAGAGALSWAALRFAWPLIGRRALVQPLVAAGQAALTLYVIHMLLIAALRYRLADGDMLWTHLIALLQTMGLPPIWASLAFALLGVAVCWMLLRPLRRRGLLLKV